ncbi:MAG: sulfatase-like hydrolase/transferase [Proteobacteria bacterium]|nr:sulfatase-like hydrolase/transferase [Pseudomonadota bacterium]
MAGTLTALNDFGAVWLWLDGWADRMLLFGRLLCFQPPAGAVAGALLGLAAQRLASADERWLATSGSLLLLPGTIVVGHLSFAGPKASELPGRPLLEAFVVGALFAGTWLALRLAQVLVREAEDATGPKRAGLAGCLLLAGFVLCKINQLVLPRLYSHAHATVSVISAFTFALMTVVCLAGRRGRRARHGLVPCGLTALCISPLVLGANLLTLDRHQNLRVALLDPRASNSRALLLAAEPLLLRQRQRPSSAVARARAARLAREQHADSLSGTYIDLPNAHILLITIDALRADHLGTYGYGRPVSPNMDALSRQAVVFERAYAQAPHSSFSLASLMASEYLHETVELKEPLPKATLATALGAYGYHTAAFYTRGIFHTAGRELRPYDRSAFGFARHEHRNLDAAAATARALLEIDRVACGNDRPVCLWIHYFDVHEPYRADSFGSSDLDRYDSEIARVDRAVQILISKMRGCTQRPVIVAITADHGEEFREHGGVYHGSSLYDEQTRVPLIVSVPGWKPIRVGTPVELVDVAPTLLALVGVTKPLSMRGNDLRPLMLGNRFDVGPAFSAVVHKRMAVRWPYKLIADLRFGLYELYDLGLDPRERNNRADEHPELLESLRGEIYAWLDSLRRQPSPDPVQDSARWRLAIDRGRLADGRSVQPLCQLVLDSSAPIELRVEASRILGRLRDQGARASLLVAMKSSNPDLSAEASIALGRLGDEAAGVRLRQLVHAEEPTLRTRAAVSLAVLRDTAAVPGLIDALWLAPTSYEREDAVRWLGRLGDPDALEPLLTLLPDVRLRYLVVVALGQLGDHRAYDALVDVLSWERQSNVRDNVVRALGLLGDPRALDQVLELAVREPELKYAPETLVRLGALQRGLVGGSNVSRRRPGSAGFRLCHRARPNHDWDYQHQSWCESRGSRVSLRLEVPDAVRTSPVTTVVITLRRQDSPGAATVDLRLGGVDLPSLGVDGRWSEHRYSLPSTVFSGATAQAVLQGPPGARFAIDHMLLVPRMCGLQSWFGECRDHDSTHALTRD